MIILFSGLLCSAQMFRTNSYYGPDEFGKGAEQQCKDAPSKYNNSVLSATGFVISTAIDYYWDHKSAVDTCEFWSISGSTVLYKNFTVANQDANDAKSWKERPFC